jgi:DNA-binding CsgD family transcriptional regulator/N-acetylneuraminic acid mutarotase
MPEYGESLSERELEILSMVATGVTNREVAHRLSISVNTVKVHLRNIFTKLGAESRTEATMIAVQEGWVVVEGAAAPPTDEETPAIDVPPPQPPLPWPKRVALIVALLLAIATTVVTWPRSRPQAEAQPDLPLDRPQVQEPTTRLEDEASAWHERAQMPTRRAHLALATVEERILAIAGQTPEGITAVVEIYDPGEDLWVRGKDKPTPVTYISSVAVGKDVYLPGGCDAAGTPLSTVEVYDAEADSWREVSPLPSPRCAYSLAAMDEQLYLFGGWNGERYVATAYIYDPQTGTWTEGPPMPTGTGFAAAAVLSNSIYVVGGYDGERELNTCAAYAPVSESWASCAPLAVGRGGLKLASLGGQLYAIGGGGWTSYLGFNERYNPSTDTWAPIETPLVGEWRSPGVVVFETTIYAVGGWSNDYLSLNQAFEALPFRIFIPVSH